MFAVLILVFAAFAIAMAMMAVGVMFSGRCLRGSCGGEITMGPDGEPLTCATCPNKDKHRHHDGDCADEGEACPRKNAAAH